MKTRIPKINSILVPTDLTEWNNQAIAFAAGIIQHGGIIHLAHVVEPFDAEHASHVHNLPLARARRAEYINDIKTQLASLAPAEAADGRMSVNPRVAAHDDVAEAVCAEADLVDADLICLATRGREGIVERVLGSIARYVMTHTSRPLMVVHGPPRYIADSYPDVLKPET